MFGDPRVGGAVEVREDVYVSGKDGNRVVRRIVR